MEKRPTDCPPFALSALFCDEELEKPLGIRATQKQELAIIHQNAEHSAQVGEKDNGASTVFKQKLTGLIAWHIRSDDLSSWLEIGPLRQVQDDRWAQIHVGHGKPPTKDVPAHEQSAVRNLVAHMLRTIEDQETEHQQRGRDNTNPKGLFGLTGQDPDNHPDQKTNRHDETRADIPLSGRRSTGY